jgi:prepilin-type N-terminal cleavage/methylation domain-containing protein
MQILSVNRQQGFTIIELVGVIILLGILAAVALPRFIDVTTEGHDAVFDATTGGFVTGAALYRAERTARGQPPANVPLQSFGGLRAQLQDIPRGLFLASLSLASSHLNSLADL